MVTDFLPVVALAAFGALAALIPMIVSRLLAPGKRSAIKQELFECGQIPIGEGRLNFMMQYYAYLLMFVVFDVMSMFLFAWGASYLELGATSSLIITIFLVILLVPMAYTLYLAGRRELW